jgi:hypothetical protein
MVYNSADDGAVTARLLSAGLYTVVLGSVLHDIFGAALAKLQVAKYTRAPDNRRCNLQYVARYKVAIAIFPRRI